MSSPKGVLPFFLGEDFLGDAFLGDGFLADGFEDCFFGFGLSCDSSVFLAV